MVYSSNRKNYGENRDYISSYGKYSRIPPQEDLSTSIADSLLGGGIPVIQYEAMVAPESIPESRPWWAFIMSMENVRLTIQTLVYWAVMIGIHQWCTTFTRHRGVEVHNMIGIPPLFDVFHDNFPNLQPYRILPEIGHLIPVLYLSGSLMYYFDQRSLDCIRTFLWAHGTLMFMRAVSFSVTLLPDASQQCHQSMFTGSCHDLIFSGHVVIMMLSILTLQHFYWVPGWIRVFLGLDAIFTSVLIILTHNHYSVDVILSVFMTPFVFMAFTRHPVLSSLGSVCPEKLLAKPSRLSFSRNRAGFCACSRRPARTASDGYEIATEEDIIRITEHAHAALKLLGLRPRVTIFRNGEPTPLYTDLSAGSESHGPDSRRSLSTVAHLRNRSRSNVHYSPPSSGPATGVPSSSNAPFSHHGYSISNTSSTASSHQDSLLSKRRYNPSKTKSPHLGSNGSIGSGTPNHSTGSLHSTPIASPSPSGVTSLTHNNSVCYCADCQNASGFHSRSRLSGSHVGPSAPISPLLNGRSFNAPDFRDIVESEESDPQSNPDPSPAPSPLPRSHPSSFRSSQFDEGAPATTGAPNSSTILQSMNPQMAPLSTVLNSSFGQSAQLSPPSEGSSEDGSNGSEDSDLLDNPSVPPLGASLDSSFGSHMRTAVAGSSRSPLRGSTVSNAVSSSPSTSAAAARVYLNHIQNRGHEAGTPFARIRAHTFHGNHSFSSSTGPLSSPGYASPFAAHQRAEREQTHPLVSPSLNSSRSTNGRENLRAPTINHNDWLDLD